MINIAMGIIPIGMMFLILTAIGQLLNVQLKIRKVIALVGFGLVVVGSILLSIHYFINGIQ